MSRFKVGEKVRILDSDMKCIDRVEQKISPVWSDEYDSKGTKCTRTEEMFDPVLGTRTTPPSEKIAHILESLNKLLQEKNKRYGNSALEPLGIFNKGDSTDGILIRLDDKLQRIKNSTELRKNDVVDIMGYLTLLCVSKGWEDFSDLID